MSEIDKPEKTKGRDGLTTAQFGRPTIKTKSRKTFLEEIEKSQKELKIDPNDTQEAKLEAERLALIKEGLYPRSRQHPLTKSNPIGRTFFFWLSELLSISKRTSWTQEMHYTLPEPERVTKHRQRFLESFSKTKDLWPTIFQNYKHHFIEVIIVMFFTSVYSFASSIFTSNVIDQIKQKVDVRDPAVLRKLILEFTAIAFIIATSAIIRKFYIFRVDRFSLRIRSAVLAAIQGKIMRFSVSNSNYFTEGNITNLLQVDTKRITQFFSEYLILVNSFMTVAVGTGYMIYVAGWKPTCFVMGTFFIIYGLYSIFYCIRARLTKRFLFHKDNRMAFFQNVLQNIEYVKIRALENFYATELFEKRERELRAQRSTVLLMSFGSTLDWMADGMAVYALIAYYSFFTGDDEKLTSAVFFATYLILSLMKDPIYFFIFIINRLVEFKISLGRISRFLAAPEVEREEKIKELPKGSEVVLRIRRGNFRWKRDEEELINKDLDKVEEVEELRKTMVRSTRHRSGGRNRLSRDNTRGKNYHRVAEEGQLQTHNFEEHHTDPVQPEEYNNQLQYNHLNTNTEQNELMVAMLKSDETEPKRAIEGAEDEVEPYEGDEFRLTNVDFDIYRGEVVIVFGESSSGKSSLLYAMLGEMISEDKNTVVEKCGEISFLGQSRWLIGDSIQENITMGKEFDAGWMDECLESSQLVHDMYNFNEGLATMMGDTSDTVSGGQRARIALSRCFYQNPDILILDDPTSSLDNKVTAKIMEGIKSKPIWREKTFVISTNNIKMFDYADKVAFMRNGNVEFFGKYEDMLEVDYIRDKIEELRQAKGVLDQEAKEERDEVVAQVQSALNEELSEEQGIEQEFAKETPEDDPHAKRNNRLSRPSLRAMTDQINLEDDQKDQQQDDPAQKQTFFLKEDKAKGALSKEVLKRFLKGSGGYLWFIFTYFVIPFVIMYGYKLVRDITVEWGNKYADYNIKDNALMNSLLYWVGYISFFGFVKRFCVFISLVWLGRTMHAKMVFRVLHSKINEFIKRTPMGQIINRFSNDIDQIDKGIGDYVYNLNYLLPKTYLNIYLIVTGVENSFMVVPIILFTANSFYLRTLYMNAKREISRLFQITRSPVVGLGASSIIGAPVIRCLGNQEYLQAKAEKLINENSKNRLIDIGLDAWFMVSMAAFDFILVQIPCYGLLLWTLYESDISTDEQFNKLTLFLVMIVDFARELSELLNFACMAEGRFISIERCKKFEMLEPEDGYNFFERDAKIFENPEKSLKIARRVLKKQKRLQMFDEGRIEISGVSARYPTGGKDVIDNVSLVVEPQEKVGIVGRTGAGKSTFIKLLWRGMAPYKGQIMFDGQDIHQIDLKTFRDQVTVISQQTNLFEGSIASNISPKPMTAEKLKKTEDLLRKLKFPESKLEVQNLMFHLETEASNLSEGEKQIISYVRGVYNKRKIVILDEASAYVDNETEKGFKELADEAFKESTVFIIAHRIQTVIDCDKILVLDNGRVLEFDTPENLLADPNTEFYKICKKA